MAKICCDYGHGGKDPGAVYKGRKESDDNLVLGRAVAAELRRHGVVVDEIRTEDKTVSLGERSGFANTKGCDYFISFHRNAFKPEQAKGVETYTYTSPVPSLFSWRRRYRPYWWVSALQTVVLRRAIFMY